LNRANVRVKKYFYALRPLLACKWIEQNKTMPPMEFSKLLNSQLMDRELKEEIEKLLQRKTSGKELKLEPQNKTINEFIYREIEYFNRYVGKLNARTPDSTKLDKIFRETLDEVWK